MANFPVRNSVFFFTEATPQLDFYLILFNMLAFHDMSIIIMIIMIIMYIYTVYTDTLYRIYDLM